MKSKHVEPKKVLLLMSVVIAVGVIILIAAISYRIVGFNQENGAANGRSALEAFKDVAGDSYVDELASLSAKPDDINAVKYMAQNSVFVLDDGAIEVYVQSYITAAESTAQAMGMSVEKLIVNEWGFESIDEYRNEARDLALSFIKEHLVVFEYAKQNKIKLKKSEYEEKIDAYAMKFGYATVDEFEYACMPSSIANEMLYDKAVEKLLN